MKAKNAQDRKLRLRGYVADVERNNGYMTLPTNDRYDVAAPDDFVLLICHDDNGDEFYVMCHKDTVVD